MFNFDQPTAEEVMRWLTAPPAAILLAQSADNNHGRMLAALQVSEVVGYIFWLADELASVRRELKALTELSFEGGADVEHEEETEMSTMFEDDSDAGGGGSMVPSSEHENGNSEDG